MTNYRIRLSKFLSYVLRHDPQKYGLKLDQYGNADLERVQDILKKRFREFKKEDLSRLVERDPKGRFEVSGGKIRATYGHSIKVRPKSENTAPPEILYHGTSSESSERILSGGLNPMDRQFVHLSLNEEDAHMVGSRHTDNPVILRVLAAKAYADGIKFFKEGCLYLVKSPPAEYIESNE